MAPIRNLRLADRQGGIDCISATRRWWGILVLFDLRPVKTIRLSPHVGMNETSASHVGQPRSTSPPLLRTSMIRVSAYLC